MRYTARHARRARTGDDFPALVDSNSSGGTSSARKGERQAEAQERPRRGFWHCQRVRDCGRYVSIEAAESSIRADAQIGPYQNRKRIVGKNRRVARVEQG